MNVAKAKQPAPLPAQRASPARLGGLDGLRGLAAVGVALLYHGQFVFAPGQFAGAPAPLRWIAAGWIEDWGWVFVDLFFVLSGYVIAHVYQSGTRLAQPRGMRDFAVARLARLYPLHFIMLLVMAALGSGESQNTHWAFLAHLLLLQAFVAPVAHTFNGPSWSLSVEAVCYALFALGAIAGKRGVRVVAVVALFIAFEALAVFNRPGGPWAEEAVLRGLLGFFTGVIVYDGRAWLGRAPGWVLAAAIVGGLMLARLPVTPLLPLGLLVWPAVLLLALRIAWLEMPVFRFLGELSYGIYLIHPAVYGLVLLRYGKLSGPAWLMALIELGLWLVIIGLAWLSRGALERPAQQWIRRLLSRASSPSAPPPARLETRAGAWASPPGV